MTEIELWQRFVGVKDGTLILSPGTVAALERAMWNEYMPKLNANISVEELNRLNNIFKDILKRKEDLFRSGRL